MTDSGVPNEVVLQVACMMMSQQYDHIISNFHTHLLRMQDQFHEGVALRSSEFEVSCRLAAPLIPFGAEQQEGAEARFARIVGELRATGEEYLDAFAQETQHLRTELAGLLQQMQEDHKANERARSDELYAVTSLCRREVSATIAQIKSEHAATGTEVEAIASLQSTLDKTLEDFASTRRQLLSVTAEFEAYRSRMLVASDEDAKRTSEAMANEREEASKRIRELINQAANERERHLKELGEVHSRNATLVEAARQQAEQNKAEADELRGEIDAMRSKESQLLTAHAKEKGALLRRITELEVELETQSLALDSQAAHARLGQVEFERLTETRKLAEAQSLKRRLVTNAIKGDSTFLSYHHQPVAASPSPSVSTIGGAARAGSPQQQQQYSVLYEAERTGISPARGSGSAPYREAGFSPPHLAANSPYAGARSPSGREGSPSASSLRSPSETYMRLQALSSNWKDKLAYGS